MLPCCVCVRRTASFAQRELVMLPWDCSKVKQEEDEDANDTEGLVHRTYAHMPPDFQSELAHDHFLQALLPADLRIQTLLAHHKVPHAGVGTSN